MIKVLISTAVGGGMGFLTYITCLQLGLQSSYTNVLRFILIGTGAASGASSGLVVYRLCEREKRNSTLRAAREMVDVRVESLEAQYSKIADSASLVALYQVKEALSEGFNHDH